MKHIHLMKSDVALSMQYAKVQMWPIAGAL